VLSWTCSRHTLRMLSLSDAVADVGAMSQVTEVLTRDTLGVLRYSVGGPGFRGTSQGLGPTGGMEMNYRRHLGGVGARLGMALLASSALIGVTTAALVVGSSSPAAAAASCTFNGQSTILTGVTPGEAIAVSCSGLPAKASVAGVEASAVAGLVSSSNQTAEADTGALQFWTATNSGTLSKSFPVPNPYADGDPNGVCPPTQAQVDAGEVGCTLAVANIATQASYGSVTLIYAGEPTPQAPVLTLSPSSAGIGDQVTITGGSGWWGNSGSVNQLTAANVSIGGTPPADAAASIGEATYDIGSPLVSPAISGSFVVPCGVPSGTPTVTVSEPDETGDPGLPATAAGTAPLTIVGGGKNPAITSISPTEGNPSGDTTVTITGCNFLGVTSVDFGTTPALSFTIDSDTQITAIAPPGIGQVDVELTGPNGKSPISIATAFGYGAQGYTLAGADGGVFAIGTSYEGSLTGSHITPAKPIVGVASTSAGTGYWLVGADGGVFAFGSAGYYGSLPGSHITPAKPIVGIASTPDGKGYWLVGADGGVFAFGSAGYYGSLPGSHVTPAKPIVGIAAAPDGNGYWLVGADGGVFSFGSAGFHGSMAGQTLAKPIVGLATTTDGGGYWLVGADGGVFSLGDAAFHGSVPGLHLSSYKPIVGITSPDSGGYDVVGSDGGVYSFGDAPFAGSAAGKALSAPIVGGTAS
jgi:hypothetical protein